MSVNNLKSTVPILILSVLASGFGGCGDDNASEDAGLDRGSDSADGVGNGTESQNTDTKTPDTETQSQGTETQPEDTGKEPEDTGKEPEDTGKEPEDTGKEPEDTGKEPEDTGTPSEDTADTGQSDTATEIDSNVNSNVNCAGPTDGTNPNRVCIRGKAYYLNGINVAWNNFNTDLSNYEADVFDEMFETLSASGGNSVRWWLFPQASSQIQFDGNQAKPLSETILTNLDSAFDSAAGHGILLMPVLLSFDIQDGDNEFLITNDSAMDAFIENVVTPLVTRYATHEGLGLWEIMNEPEWLLDNESGPISMEDMQRFHGKVAAAIHAADSDALVTSGFAMYKYLADGGNRFSDTILQAAADDDPLATLDVNQVHYYSWMHGDNWSYEPWKKTSNEWLPENKPIIIGEFPCNGEEGRYTPMEMHLGAVEKGYAGTYCWAYFDNRADKAGYWADAKAPIEAIAIQIPDAITGE